MKIGLIDYGFISSDGFGKTAFNDFLNNEKEPNSLKLDQYDPQEYLGKKGLNYLNNATKLLSSTYFQTFHNAGLEELIQCGSERVAVYNGSELVNLADDFEFDLTAKNEGPSSVSPMKAPNTLANVASSFFSLKSDIRGPNVTVSAGQCGGLSALDLSCLHIHETLCDVAIVGSVEITSKYHDVLKGKKDGPYCPELGIACLVASEKFIQEKNLNCLAYLDGFDSRMTHSHPTHEEGAVYLITNFLSKQSIPLSSISTMILSTWPHFNKSLFLDKLRHSLHDEELPLLIDSDHVFGYCQNAGSLLATIQLATILQDNTQFTSGLVLAASQEGYSVVSLVRSGQVL